MQSPAELPGPARPVNPRAKMSAAIAALASYGGSDSEPDSEPETESGSQRSAAVLASRDAVLHLRPPPAAPPALPVDAAPEVAVKVGNPPGPGPPACPALCPLCRPRGRPWSSPRLGKQGRKAAVPAGVRCRRLALPCLALRCGVGAVEGKACVGELPLSLLKRVSSISKRALITVP